MHKRKTPLEDTIERLNYISAYVDALEKRALILEKQFDSAKPGSMKYSQLANQIQTLKADYTYSIEYEKHLIDQKELLESNQQRENQNVER